MKRLICTIVCAGFVFAGAQALADDSMQNDSTHHQMMKDCMAKHAAKNDGMSKADMKKACGDEMKMQKSANTPTDSPLADKKIGTGDTSNGGTPNK